MSTTEPQNARPSNLTDAGDIAPRHAADRPAMLGYRADIEGVRAIAILAVVFHHFNVPGFSGGFVGIDIFFVISGYLIGNYLWREQKNTGQLSLGQFYLRRIRRLAPAFFVMAFAVVIAGAFVLLPNDFRETAKGVIASTVLLSNILFFGQSELLKSGAEDIVMLHTWPLSVAAQFYVILPLLFLLLGRHRTAFLWTLGAVFGLSFIGYLVATPLSHPAAFFLMPLRAWEFLAGVGLAVLALERPEMLRRHQAMCWIGLVLVLGSIVWMTPNAAFAGWQVVIPVLGTVLLIGNGDENNWANRVLSMRVPVLLGLISYSLYLWHWPVLTLTKYIRGSYLGPGEVSLWIAVSVVLATLSWRLVEQPVRNAKSLPGMALVSTAGLATVCLLAVCFSIYRSDGIPKRFTPQAQMHIAAGRDTLQDLSACHVPVEGPFEGLEVCPIGPKNALRNLLIWGDHHAQAYFEGLTQAARETKRGALVIMRPGCPPVFDVSKRDSKTSPTQDSACAKANAQIRTALSTSLDISDVMLIGQWAYYASGQGSGSDAHITVRLSSPVHGPMTQDALLGRALKATTLEIGGMDRGVFVLRQPPEIPSYHAARLGRALVHNHISPQLARRLGQITVTDAKTREAGAAAALAASGATVLDPWPTFCDPFLCDAVQGTTGMYTDSNRVTTTAARRMRSVFYPVMVHSTQ